MASSSGQNCEQSLFFCLNDISIQGCERKTKYVDCYPTNGSGIAFTGISGQIDTHVRKGTYVVRWVGAAAGPIWIAVLRPDVQIGFSL